MAHEKRISFGKKYPVKGRGKFIVVPSSGPHPKDFSIPLSVVLRDFLEYGENLKEAKNIIRSGKVLVDGKVRKDYRYPVGIFDVIEILEINKTFRVVPGEKRLEIIEIPKKEKNLKLCRIENKALVKGGKQQLNLNDGKNILSGKGTYETGDTLVIKVPKLHVKKQIKRKKNALCMVIKGQNKGRLGKIKKIEKTEDLTPNKIEVKLGKRKVSLPEKFIFVVGSKKPEIKVSGK